MYFIITGVIFISLNSAISKYAVTITLKEIIFHFWQKMLIVSDTWYLASVLGTLPQFFRHFEILIGHIEATFEYLGTG